MKVLKPFIRVGERFRVGDDAPSGLDTAALAHYRRLGIIEKAPVVEMAPNTPTTVTRSLSPPAQQTAARTRARTQAPTKGAGRPAIDTEAGSQAPAAPAPAGLPLGPVDGTATLQPVEAGQAGPTSSLPPQPQEGGAGEPVVIKEQGGDAAQSSSDGAIDRADSGQQS